MFNRLTSLGSVFVFSQGHIKFHKFNILAKSYFLQFYRSGVEHEFHWAKINVSAEQVFLSGGSRRESVSLLFQLFESGKSYMCDPFPLSSKPATLKVFDHSSVVEFLSDSLPIFFSTYKEFVITLGPPG